eukprot:PhF_6_TR1418/c0_g1_i3/m.2482/K20303/TRAPPC4, TRS23; trafficking protein particle complex subunit 4
MYGRDFGSGRHLSDNERITWAAALHGFMALSQELSPVQDSSPTEVIETQEFTLHIYTAPTELRIIVSTHTSVTKVDTFVSEVYMAYSDYVLKNPFYTVDQFGCGQTITSKQCVLFHQEMEKVVTMFNKKH